MCWYYGLNLFWRCQLLQEGKNVLILFLIVAVAKLFCFESFVFLESKLSRAFRICCDLTNRPAPFNRHVPRRPIDKPHLIFLILTRYCTVTKQATAWWLMMNRLPLVVAINQGKHGVYTLSVCSFVAFLLVCNNQTNPNGIE